MSVTFPTHWEVTSILPDTPSPLTTDQLAHAIDHPVGQSPLEELARGKGHVVIVVDDLSRPTPTYRVLPLVLERLNRAGVRDEHIVVVVATGTHGNQHMTAIKNKLGADSFARCRVQIHNDLRDTVYVGKTSFATKVFVNHHVEQADLVIGIGGVYPQHTTGFGGGAKLALGVCGRRTIMDLHTKHPSMDGTYVTDNTFRQDLSEIADLIGLNTIVTLHIDGCSNVVRAVSGDHAAYYPDASAFSRSAYDAPVADESWDVVIANAYPLDTSFTFMRKGYKALYTAPRKCVKVMIASAFEGVGHHGLFQFIDPSPWSRIRNLMIRLKNVDKKTIPQKLWRRITRLVAPTPKAPSEEKITALPPNSDHLYIWRTDSGEPVPAIDDVTVMRDWSELVQHIDDKHFAGRQCVRACVYTCAPLQCLDAGRSEHGEAT